MEPILILAFLATLVAGTSMAISRPMTFFAFHTVTLHLVLPFLGAVAGQVSLSAANIPGGFNVLLSDSLTIPLFLGIGAGLLRATGWKRLACVSGSVATIAVAFLAGKTFLAPDLSPALGELREQGSGWFMLLYALVHRRELRDGQWLALAVKWFVILAPGLFLARAVMRGVAVGSLDPANRFCASDAALVMAVIAIACIIGPSALSHWSSRQKTVLLSCLVLLVFFANHRSAWLALAGGGLVAGASLLSEKAKRYSPSPALAVLPLVAAVAIGAIFLGFRSDGLGEKSVFESTLEARVEAFVDPLEDSTASWRAQIWETRLTWLQFEGAQYFGRSLGQRIGVQLGLTYLTVASHNTYVTAIEMGGYFLLGLYLLLLLIGVLCTVEVVSGTANAGINRDAWFLLAGIVAIVLYQIAYEMVPFGMTLVAQAIALREHHVGGAGSAA